MTYVSHYNIWSPLDFGDAMLYGMAYAHGYIKLL